MNMHARGLAAAVLLAGLAGWLGAAATYEWPFSVQAQTGQEAHWTSPTAVDVQYARYYSRVDAHVKVELRVVVVWVTVLEEDRLDFGELIGPIPAEGLVAFQEHIAESGEGYTVEADVTVWVDGSGYFHVDVTNFASNQTLRITVTGTVRVLATATVYGDFTGDGWVDSLDVLACARCLAGTDPPPDPLAAVDMDGSGGLDARDLALLQNFAAGNLPTAFVDWTF
jgi:hypothetical protein